MRYVLSKILVFSFSLFTLHTLHALHNTSRYFPFLEPTSNYVPRNRPYLNVAPFYSTTATCYKRNGRTGGVPELWGAYDLHDVIASLHAVKPALPNPIIDVTGSNEFVDKSITYRVDGRINAVGLSLGYEHNLKINGLSLGAWIPLMTASSLGRYNFNNKEAFAVSLGRPISDAEYARLDNTIDKIRRITHDEIGFKVNRWEETGFGDLDLHARFNRSWDHALLMRTISMNTQIGVVCPTGTKVDLNNPLSVPFMSGGHWAFYFEILPEFELKQDLKFGFMFGLNAQVANQKVARIPIYQEPANFSALAGLVDIHPGLTMKFAPYLILENLVDGLHFQARYTYLLHGHDTWHDIREDQSIPSYLTLKESDQFALDEGILQADIIKNIKNKEWLSSWKSHYLTVQLVYDSKQGLLNWATSPNFYVNYDMPFAGKGMSKNHQVTVGVELHF